ncbi:MAG TPA: FadR/GntR family transcriptional regulator [Solirubrobacteraceae bacterium]
MSARATPPAAGVGSLQPVPRAPLYEGVATRLREFIEVNRLAPGDRLPGERDLAAQLGVSRTSVRQGLTILRVIGLVDVQHGNGIYIARNVQDVLAPITADLVMADPELPALGEVRNALEAQAARLAATRRTPEDLAALAGTIARMRADIELGGFGIEADRDFHRGIVRAAVNQVLADTLDTLADGAGRIAAASLQRPGQAPRSLADHEAILRAIESAEADEANRLMMAHLDRTGALDEPS